MHAGCQATPLGETCPSAGMKESFKYLFNHLMENGIPLWVAFSMVRYQTLKVSIGWMIDSEGTQKPEALFSQHPLLKVQTSSETGISLLANIIYLGGDTTSNLPLND